MLVFRKKLYKINKRRQIISTQDYTKIIKDRQKNYMRSTKENNITEQKVIQDQ